MHLRELISKLPIYQDLNKLQIEITFKKTNIMHLQDAVKIAKNIGYEKWSNMSSFSERNKNIVKQILESKN